MKLRKEKGKWIITDKGRTIVFDSSNDAWQYIFMMKEIRPIKVVRPSIYPVRSLIPPMKRRCVNNA